jgi:hypothetical protein
MIFILVLILSLVLQLFLPWYIIAPVAFLINLWKSKTAVGAFGQAFLAAALLWGAYAGYLHFQSDGILSVKIAPLFLLPVPELLVVVTMLIAGLVAGMSGLTGYYAKVVFFSIKDRRGFRR